MRTSAPRPAAARPAVHLRALCGLPFQALWRQHSEGYTTPGALAWVHQEAAFSALPSLQRPVAVLPSSAHRTSQHHLLTGISGLNKPARFHGKAHPGTQQPALLALVLVTGAGNAVSAEADQCGLQQQPGDQLARCQWRAQDGLPCSLAVHSCIAAEFPTTQALVTLAPLVLHL